MAEMELLVDVSSTIAAVRDRDDLFRALSEQLRPIFQFETAVVTTYSKDLSHYRHLLNNASAKVKAHPLYSQLVGDFYLPIANSPDAFLLERFGEDDLYFSRTADMAQRYPSHQIISMMTESELHYNVHTALRYQGQIIGFFHFHYTKESAVPKAQFGLVRALAKPLAVAVANILANEEFQRREQEQATLLNISEIIAASRNRHDLLKLVYEQIRPKLPFDFAGLFYFCDVAGRPDPQGDYHVCLLENVLEDPTIAQPGEIPPGPIRQGNELFKAIAATKVGLGDLTYLQQKYPDYPYLPRLRRLGIQHVLAGQLRHGGETIGLLSFDSATANYYSEEYFPLFEALANLLATALSNILANEGAAERERENTLQVELHSALEVAGNWETRLLGLSRVMQLVVPHDYIVFCVSDPALPHAEHFYRFERIGFDDYRYLDTAAFCRLTGLPPIEHETLLQEARSAPAQLLQGDDFTAARQRNKMIDAAARTFQLQSQLRMPVPLSRGGRCVVVAYSQQTTPYRPEHLARLARLLPTLSLTLEKLLAYDEIRSLNEQLQQEKTYLREELQTTYNFEEIIGSGPALQQAFRRIHQVAPTDATVLLEGETGTGKELFARALHEASPRRPKVLVKVNCAALPAQLIESELFGHEKGAFTGAHERRIGKFELAQGSTIFLDEIGEMPLELQAKLLRVLQEKEFERLGGNKVFRADVRVVAATNRDLQREVAEGRFRADLFFRLNVVPIRLPALRERPEDVPLLAQHFLHKYAKRFGKNVRSIAPVALHEMKCYHWPGNVRELEHLVEQSLILNETSVLELSKPLVRTTEAAALEVGTLPVRTWQEAERDNILAALRLTEGRIRGPRGAARLLDIHPNTLDSRIEKLDIGKTFGKKEK